MNDKIVMNIDMYMRAIKSQKCDSVLGWVDTVYALNIHDPFMLNSKHVVFTIGNYHMQFFFSFLKTSCVMSGV